MPLRVQGTPIPPPTAPATAAPPGAPTQALLGIPRIAQEQDNWCWAACCEMLFGHRGISGVSQCDMASWMFGKDCCTNPDSQDCDKAAWPDTVMTHWGVAFTFSNSTLSFASLQSEINGNRPVEAYYQWAGGGAHVALVRGWYSNNEVHVNDPWYTHGRISYTDLVAAYGLGSWAGSYTF